MAEELTIRMIMTLLQSEYQNSFVNMDKRTMQLKMNLWEKEFAADDINLVYAAVRLYMEKPERFAPNIGQIRENMNTLLKADTQELSDQSAWALVSKACANGLYHYREEFEKLPPEVQRAVGGPEQLKAWARMDAETVESVVASNFKKTYRATQERAKQVEALAPGIKDMLSGITAGMSIEAHAARQIEAQKEPTKVPAKLEPMIYTAVGQAPKPSDAKPESYKPMEPEEWEKRRDEFLRKLTGGQT